MGQSTDAILFYGYCWDEEASNPWAGTDEEGEEDENAGDWEVRYALTKGCLPPSTPFPDRQVKPTQANGWSSTPKDYTAAENAIIKQYKAYWDKRRQIVEAAPCLVDAHCSDECQMPYVAVRKSVTVSNRGCPSKITGLTVDPTWDAALAEFCEVMGIKTKGKKAAWWLVSYWG